MKKLGLLISFLSLFLVACSPVQNIEDEKQNILSSGDILDDTISGPSFVDSNPQAISSLISFKEGPYNELGYDEEGYNREGYNEKGYNRWGYNKEEGYKRWGSTRGWGEESGIDYSYGLPPRREQHYLLQRMGDVTLVDRANTLPIYTNDLYRDIQPLELKKADKDIASYRCFYCDVDRNAVDYVGMDKNSIFIDLFLALATPKSSLPNYIPLQSLGTQAFDGMVGYSDGYLVFFPFKFPVNETTFKMVQRKEQLQYGKDENIPSLTEIAGEFRGLPGEFRRPRFQNVGEVIDRYLGDDKDWVYYRTPGGGVSIDRVKKASDFKILSPNSR